MEFGERKWYRLSLYAYNILLYSYDFIKFPTIVIHATQLNHISSHNYKI